MPSSNGSEQASHREPTRSLVTVRIRDNPLTDAEHRLGQIDPDNPCTGSSLDLERNPGRAGRYVEHKTWAPTDHVGHHLGSPTRALTERQQSLEAIVVLRERREELLREALVYGSRLHQRLRSPLRRVRDSRPDFQPSSGPCHPVGGSLVGRTPRPIRRPRRVSSRSRCRRCPGLTVLGSSHGEDLIGRATAGVGAWVRTRHWKTDGQ